MNRTYSAKPSDIERKWWVVDAAGVPIGRLAAQVAQVLVGKHKPMFTYSMDVGDFVIVVNAEKAVLSGRKREELIHHHTGWPGGLRSIERGRMHDETPTKLVEKVVWGMMPKTKLGRAMFKKLKVYAGPEHKHDAQSPEPLKVTRD